MTTIDLTKVWTVYVMVVCLEKKTYFKVGRTNRIESRIVEVQCGCPVPIEYILRVDGLAVGASLQVEAEIHEGLKAWNTSGEWFCFDLTDKHQKQTFNKVCGKAFRNVLGLVWAWKMSSVQEAKKAGQEFSEKRRQEMARIRRSREMQEPECAAERRSRGLAPRFWG